MTREGGGIGRRAGFRIQWATVGVRVPPLAPPSGGGGFLTHTISSESFSAELLAEGRRLDAQNTFDEFYCRIIPKKLTAPDVSF